MNQAAYTKESPFAPNASRFSCVDGSYELHLHLPCRATDVDVVFHGPDIIVSGTLIPPSADNTAPRMRFDGTDQPGGFFSRRVDMGFGRDSKCHLLKSQSNSTIYIVKYRIDATRSSLAGRSNGSGVVGGSPTTRNLNGFPGDIPQVDAESEPIKTVKGSSAAVDNGARGDVDARIKVAEQKVEDAEKRAKAAEARLFKAEKQTEDVGKRAQTAEVARSNAEKKAETAEATRIGAARKAETAEAARIDALKEAESAEAARVEALKGAEAAEVARIDAEKKAEAEEEARVDAENKAKTAEAARVDAVKTAETAEAARIDAEKEAEAARKKVEELEQDVKNLKDKIEELKNEEPKPN